MYTKIKEIYPFIEVNINNYYFDRNSYLLYYIYLDQLYENKFNINSNSLKAFDLKIINEILLKIKSKIININNLNKLLCSYGTYKLLFINVYPMIQEI